MNDQVHQPTPAIRTARRLWIPWRWPGAVAEGVESLQQRVAEARRGWRMRHRPLERRPGMRKLFPFDPPRPQGGWSYHDETWVRVVNRFEHRRLLRTNRALSVQDDFQELSEDVTCQPDGSIRADLAPTGQQKWVWLFLEPRENIWHNFRWAFTVRRETDFRELQFGFRYIDFYNRYRFRHERDHLRFDTVVNGVFENDIHTVPFRMDPDREYRYVIEARENRFVLEVDGVVMLDEVDKRNLFPRGSIAVILWEDKGTRPIRVAVTGIEAVET